MHLDLQLFIKNNNLLLKKKFYYYFKRKDKIKKWNAGSVHFFVTIFPLKNFSKTNQIFPFR